MKLRIYDDDGFIAIVNNVKYQGFVDDDWELDQLMTHFVTQMNAGNLIIWQTSNDGGGDWIVSFRKKPSGADVFRQFD